MHLVKNATNVKPLVVVTTEQQLQKQVNLWRKLGEKIAFVPTMGHLHAGHIALVEAAYEVADRVIVSIYVNPAQFGKNEDLDTYPRTFDEDNQKLAQVGVDLVFAPDDELMYPGSVESTTFITVNEISSILDGEFRPSFFTGVATVVNKLFNMVKPDVAVFGEKDYQQLQVIKKMVVDLALPVEIISAATIREEDGLAMSSRNGFLQPNERKQASYLYKVLHSLVEALRAGEIIEKAERHAIEQLQKKHFDVDYVSVRQRNLMPATLAAPDVTQWVVLAAARLGGTRLIDNLQFELPNLSSGMNSGD